MVVMLKRLRRSWVDITLVIVLVAAAAVAFSFLQANTEAVQEAARLETRIKVAELDLSDAKKASEAVSANLSANLTEKEANLETLRQTLEQAQSALAENPFPSEAEAVALTNEILQYAEKQDITIAAWTSSYTSIEKYRAIRHSLSAEGKVYGLISFIEALTHASVTPVVQTMDITSVEGKKGIWHTKLEVTIYYR